MAQYVSPEFIAAIKSGRQFPISKVEILDGLTRTVESTITGVDEGTVTIDVARGTRRTFQLRMTNPDGIHTPTSSSSNFAFSSLVRIYRGLKYDNGLGGFTEEYVLLGTFMVDRAETLTERNMSVLTVDGSDLWKKIGSGGFPSGQTFPVGTHINTIIATVATISGIASYHIGLDPLTNRTVDGYETGTTIQWEPGDNRSEFLLNLAKQWGISIYFNPFGILSSAETPNIEITDPVWTFSAGEDAIMLGVTRVQSDLTLINHVVVTGESTEGVPDIRYEISDDDPLSPTYTGLIGDRVFVFVGPQITTAEQAQDAAEKLYAEKVLIEDDIRVPMICLPHLEGNDVVHISEPTWTKVSERYICTRFDIPLRESRMTIEGKKARAVPA